MSTKILLLLADGMRPDFVLGCGNAFAGEFLRESAYTLEGQAVMPSVTLPCHMSLFHSVASDRHGILTNTWTPQVRPVRGLCEVLRAAGKRSGFFYDWDELRDLTRPGSLTRSHFLRGGDLSYEKTMVLTMEAVLASLRDDGLDFMFVYFGLPDTIGHKYGFMSEEYRAAVHSVWGGVKRIKEALPEEYGMVVTADHGGHGRSHGDDCPEDMTIPIIFNGSAFSEINAQKIAHANIMDIAPTVVQAVGVDADPDWEGVSLF
jgi:predicted AlkP superfamily pyrophosphatase or phosphodiesterase